MLVVILCQLFCSCMPHFILFHIVLQLLHNKQNSSISHFAPAVLLFGFFLKKPTCISYISDFIFPFLGLLPVLSPKYIHVF